MMELKTSLGKRIGALSVREQIILLVLVGLVVVFGVDQLFSTLYLDRRNVLKEDVAQAEEQFQHHQRNLSRKDWIHSEYQKLDNPIVTNRDSVLTETAVLRRLSELAGRGLRVTSVVPRMGVQEGRQVMLVALDFEGRLEAVIAYLNELLNEMPVMVNSLSLAPRVGKGEGVVCRTSIRIECCDQ